MSDHQPVDPSIERIAELQQLIADFSKIQRMVSYADTGRKENDVDHSFGLALTCWFLAPKIAPNLDLHKIVLYALAHDLVELHSGDTYVFDAEGVKTKAVREAAAIKKLQEEWPDFPEMIDYMQGYSDKRDEEAKFVYTVDKMLPPILINLGEKNRHWTAMKVTREMHDAEKRAKMVHSPELQPYLEALLDWTHNPDHFYNPDTDDTTPAKH
jgi:putative hydrolase of HD superfamily